MEHFNATCRENEVIIVEHARYGRMRLGKCVTVDYGYVGCTVNVDREVERRCAGRRHCRFQVPDSAIYWHNPCPMDFASYLEVQYFCLRGTYV